MVRFLINRCAEMKRPADECRETLDLYCFRACLRRPEPKWSDSQQQRRIPLCRSNRANARSSRP
ncbi:hypothetical protein F4V90_31690 [Neorhizobium galegae]|nr:hypothetical protein F4V90_31690 [Neorhizobium galegae]